MLSLKNFNCFTPLAPLPAKWYNKPTKSSAEGGTKNLYLPLLAPIFLAATEEYVYWDFIPSFSSIMLLKSLLKSLLDSAFDSLFLLFSFFSSFFILLLNWTLGANLTCSSPYILPSPKDFIANMFVLPAVTSS